MTAARSLLSRLVVGTPGGPRMSDTVRTGPRTCPQPTTPVRGYNWDDDADARPEITDRWASTRA